jgi:UDP-2,3-diacylglucosamine hydrolase
VSDVHLGDHDPDTAEWFMAELAAHACAVSHLFVLGDLFEAWVGDDWADEVSSRLLAQFTRLSMAGIRLLVMRGNRDFLLDVGRPQDPCDALRSAASFSARCGATMLDDPCVIDLFGTQVLLAHGDALCTDDIDYQQFRLQARHPAWQQAFLAQPLEARIAAARAMRAQSEQSKGGKAGYLMDVNAGAVADAMRRARVRCLIHGHTHRPAEHRFELDGALVERWVLPDWDAGGHPATAAPGPPGRAAERSRRGGFLRVDARGWQRLGDWPPDLSRPSG